MSRSRFALSLRSLRIGLACVVCFDIASLEYFLQRARRLADASSVDAVTLAVASPWVSHVVAALGAFAAVRFAMRPGRLAEAGGALAALAALSHAHAALEGSPWRHLYFSGTCLLGWIAGGIVARRRGAPENESLARVGAIAMLGAAYCNAALSKLVYGGGLAWLDGHTLRYTIIAQDGLVGSGLLHDVRELAVGVPIVAVTLATATVLFELSGPAMLVGPRVRACVAGGLVAMHASVFVLTGIPYLEAVALLTLFALPFADAEPPEVWGPPPRAGAVIGIGLAVIVALSLAREAARGSETPSEHHEPPPRARVGPLSLGRELGGSRIERLDIDADAIVVEIAGPEGTATFDVMCRETTDEGPWDEPPLHLFYRPTDRSLDSLAAPAHALAAALGASPCASLPSWLHEPE